jgi:hypothetical protein
MFFCFGLQIAWLLLDVTTLDSVPRIHLPPCVLRVLCSGFFRGACPQPLRYSRFTTYSKRSVFGLMILLVLFLAVVQASCRVFPFACSLLAILANSGAPEARWAGLSFFLLTHIYSIYINVFWLSYIMDAA